MTKRLQNRTRDSTPNQIPGATISAARSDNSLVQSSSSWSAISIPSMSALPSSQAVRLPPPPLTPSGTPGATSHSTPTAPPVSGNHPLSEPAPKIPNPPGTQEHAQSGQTHPARRKPRVSVESSKPSSKRNSLYISNSSTGGDPPAPARQFTVTCVPDQGGYIASPLRKSRRPSPTPQSISSSSSKSSVSYVSLKSGKQSAHMRLPDRSTPAFGHTIPTSDSEHIVARLVAPALRNTQLRRQPQPQTALYEPLDDQEGETEYDIAANLLLPEERERVHLWATQVVNSAVPEEDVILADGETVARLSSRLGVDLSAAPTPVEDVSLERHPFTSALTGAMSLILQSDPRWIVDAAKKKWTWHGFEAMPPLPQDAVVAGYEAQPLDLGFRQSSTATLRQPHRYPLVETPGSYPTPDQSTPVAQPIHSVGPTTSHELLPPHHELVPLISPSPLSQLPPLRARARSPTGQPIVLPSSAPEPSISSYQGQAPYRDSSPRREPSPEVPGRLVVASAAAAQEQLTAWSGGSKSTKSGRGRSPTRRSWKATSHRSKVSKGFTVTPPNKMLNHKLDHDQTGLTDISSSPSRPRTTTRSPSLNRSLLPTPGPVADLTDSPSITSSKLFFGFATGPIAPLPLHPADVSHSASVGPPPTIISIPTQASPVVDRLAPWHNTLSTPIASALPSHFRRRSVPATVMSLNGSLATSTDLPSHHPSPLPVPLSRNTYTGNQPQAFHISKQHLPHFMGPSNPPSEMVTPRHEPSKPDPSSFSDAFLRLLTTVNDFTSEISSDKRGTPRWKTENVDLAERVREAYYEFHQQVARTRVRFRPWMSSGKEFAADEATLVDELDGDRAKALGPVMYLDDVMEELEGTTELKRRSSADEVQERITQSIVKQWKQLAMDCLNNVQRLLANYVSSMIFSHFSQNAVEELENLVVSVVQTQLKALLADTAIRLQDIITLEYSNIFSLSINRYHSSRTLLSRYKSLRHRTRRTYVMHNQPNTVPQPSRPYADISGHSHPGLASQYSYGYSRSAVGAQSMSPRHPNSTAIARLKRFSLLGSGSDSTEYHQDMKLALAGLANLGFKDMDADRLCELLSEDDPSDEALEVMAEVDSYFEVASSRFSDYVAIQIEHHFVNQLGPRINDALLRALNLAGDDIKERAARWMPVPQSAD